MEATPHTHSLERIAALRATFERGVLRDPAERAKRLLRLAHVLEQREDAVLEAMRADMGKPALEAYIAEVGVLGEELRNAAREVGRWAAPRPVPTPLKLQLSSSTVHPCPLGVVLIVAPWNYPLLLVLGPLAAALAAGNCAVVKPSEDAPHTAALVERLVREAGLEELVHVVQGAGRAVLPPLLEAVRFDHVFFTGSAVVGARIAAQCAPKLVPVTLELGGKSPAIVDRSAHLPGAVRRIAWSKFFNAGQTCVSADHVLVHADRYEAFLQAFAHQVERMFGADPQRSPDLARIVNDRRWQVLRGHLDHGTVYLGGGHDRATRYIAPTVLTDVPLDSPPMREEIFGPILPVLPWRDRDELAALTARNPEPLSAYLFARDAGLERWFTQELPFGGGCINDTMVHFGNAHLPFGGVGRSGMGRYHGRAGFDRFSNLKGVMHSNDRLDPGVRYAPYRPWQLKVLRRLFR
ncbi:MAG TPA: aldehyde dehydrogenase family protein [Flavobacteriales bacterium]|nr:aldehyde dehydrogenase family protein [Flavobacteriales bacterium]HMR26978.1 aldehyde dehydrogenase family protein [Flavobacteriales bacterium]